MRISQNVNRFPKTRKSRWLWAEKRVFHILTEDVCGWTIVNEGAKLSDVMMKFGVPRSQSAKVRSSDYILSDFLEDTESFQTVIESDLPFWKSVWLPCGERIGWSVKVKGKESEYKELRISVVWTGGANGNGEKWVESRYILSKAGRTCSWSFGGMGDLGKRRHHNWLSSFCL